MWKFYSHNIIEDVTSMSFNSLLNEPIQWLKGEKEFAAAALNRLYYRIISNLPTYKAAPHELANGIAVPGGKTDFHFFYP